MLSKALSILMVLLFIGGCASVGVQKTPTFINGKTGKKTNFTIMTVTSVNAFAPTTTVKFFLECEEPAGVDDSLENTTCIHANVGREHAAPGVITGFGSAVVNSSVIGAFFIGEGLKGSGDREINNNNAENNVENTSETTSKTISEDFNLDQNIAGDQTTQMGSN